MDRHRQGPARFLAVTARHERNQALEAKRDGAAVYKLYRKLDGHDFDVRFNCPNQVLDAFERARDRAWTSAASALVVDAEIVSRQANHVQVAAIALQRGPDSLVE